jgi:septum formation protein
MKPLILASTSPRRSGLLRRAGYRVEVCPSRVQESSSAQLSPYELTLLNAGLKARQVAEENPEAVVLGADTVVALENKVFGKPADLRAAGAMLGELAGKTHLVVTSFCLVCRAWRKTVTAAEFTYVTLKPLSEAQIARYHALVNPLDKAGAYGAQSSAELVIERVEGSFDNVVGLPLAQVRHALAKFKIFPAVDGAGNAAGQGANAVSSHGNP